MANLKGKVIAITGGASGIGLATAIYLVRRGASVALADIQAGALDAAAAAMTQASASVGEVAAEVKVTTTVIDVRNSNQVDQWIADTVAQFGRLDGAANLAGVFSPSSTGLQGIRNEDWDFVLGINATGLMYCLRAQLKSISEGGSIVNASSLAGLIGSPNYPAYTASKHAVIGLTKCAAREVGDRGVRVNCICPGRIATPMMQQVRNVLADTTHKDTLPPAIQRDGTPEEIAALIVFLLGDESKFITGSDYRIDGGRLC